MRVRSAYGALLTLISPPCPMRDYGGRVMAAMLLFSSPARHEHIAGDEPEPALQHERDIVDTGFAERRLRLCAGTWSRSRNSLCDRGGGCARSHVACYGAPASRSR